MAGCELGPFTSFANVVDLAKSLSGQLSRIFWFGFAALSWVLWTIRNKFSIEHVFPNKPDDCIYKLLNLLQLWNPLVKAGDKEATELLISHVKATAAELTNRDRDSMSA